MDFTGYYSCFGDAPLKVLNLPSFSRVPLAGCLPCHLGNQYCQHRPFSPPLRSSHVLLPLSLYLSSTVQFLQLLLIYPFINLYIFVLKFLSVKSCLRLQTTWLYTGGHSVSVICCVSLLLLAPWCHSCFQVPVASWLVCVKYALLVIYASPQSLVPLRTTICY